MKRELLRKGVHVLLAFFFAAASVFLTQQVLFLFVGVLFVALILLRKTKFAQFLRGVPRVNSGEFFFVFGVTSVIFLTGGAEYLFRIAMLILALADTSASLIGIFYGKHQYKVFGEIRSFEGSFACALVSMSIFLLFGYSFIASILAGTLLALVEALSCKGSDNLSLPITAVLTAFFLG